MMKKAKPACLTGCPPEGYDQRPNAVDDFYNMRIGSRSSVECSGFIACPAVAEVTKKSILMKKLIRAKRTGRVNPSGKKSRVRASATDSCLVGAGSSGQVVGVTQSILFLTLMNNMFIEPVVLEEPMPDLFALPFIDDDSDDAMYIVDTGAGAHLHQWLANMRLHANKKTINFITANGRVQSKGLCVKMLKLIGETHFQYLKTLLTFCL